MSDEVSQLPMRSAQLESLHRDLADARLQAAQLKEKLDGIEQSPGWRLIATYRKWLNKGRATTRIIDGAARFGIRLFSTPRAKDPPAVAPPPEPVAVNPAEKAARGTLIHCLDPGYMGRVLLLVATASGIGSAAGNTLPVTIPHWIMWSW